MSKSHSSHAKIVLAFLPRLPYSVHMMNERDKHMNASEALARLQSADQNSLFEMCFEAHKDQYNVKGRHMSAYTKQELINWWEAHYYWNEEKQYWASRVDFDMSDFPESVPSDFEPEYDDEDNAYVRMLKGE